MHVQKGCYMSTIRRSRIKASASHLASLAGKRRANQEATKLVKDEIQDTKNSKKAEEPPSQKELASDNVVDKDNVSTTSLVSTVSEETPKEVITCDEVTNKAVEKLDNVPSVATAVASPRPLLKSRFRPNLSESDQQRGRLIPYLIPRNHSSLLFISLLEGFCSKPFFEHYIKHYVSHTIHQGRFT